MANPSPGLRDRPDHKIMLDTGPDSVTVTLNGAIVAATTMGVVLREDGYPACAYVPWSDITADLSPTDKSTHCPFKGDTVYYTVTVDGSPQENAAWSYQKPYDEMAAIGGHVAFDDRFEVKIG